MAKPKRPIVPVRKPVDRQPAAKHGQAHTTHPAKPLRPGNTAEAGSNRVGGGRGKRQRESDDLDAKHSDIKRRKQHALAGAGGSWRGRDADRGASGQWRPLSIVHQQAAFAVQRLLEASSSRKHGASLKSLTLAPHIEAKKATFAVTCQVLKFSRILEQLDERAGLTSSSQPKLGKYVAMVLSYELLRGQGLARKGQAERAVLAAESRLRSALEALLREEGVQSLDELLAAQQQQGGGGGGDGGGPQVPHPRWVRVNTLKADADDVVRQLEEHLRTTTAKKTQQAPEKERRQQQQQPVGEVVRDALLPAELLALPAGTDLHDHPLVTRGSVVLQSKASCMPARALAPEPGWTVVDCCAAPGNKTTHLAAIMGNKGRVLAFDKDPKRLARLRANAALTGASCIEPRLADFLSLDLTDPEFRQVRAVLLDPSCSGSGTTFTRMDHLLPSHIAAAAAGARQPPSVPAATAAATTTTATATTSTTTKAETADAKSSTPTQATEGQGKKQKKKKKNKRDQQQQQEQEQQQQAEHDQREQEGGAAAAGRPDQYMEPNQDAPLNQQVGPEPQPEEVARVAQLARFQAAALSHALRFPALERLVYSTCSAHVEENEAVVAGAMQQAAEAGMELADPFPSWPRRGLPLFPGAEKLVRTDAYQDGTDGFFVALFQRRPQRRDEEQQQQQQQSGLPQPAESEPEPMLRVAIAKATEDGSSREADGGSDSGDQHLGQKGQKGGAGPGDGTGKAGEGAAGDGVRKGGGGGGGGEEREEGGAGRKRARPAGQVTKSGGRLVGSLKGVAARRK